ncbi:MAG TPA: response regulator [Xanthobacteraceae bacterium]|nr:response regulator [Xanthobacteraceae bacterium]
MSAENENTLGPWRGPLSWLPYRQSRLPAAEGGAGPQAPLQQPGRILIVEDDVLIASQMEAALADAGFDVIAAVTTGEEAIAVARAQAPDLAVVDMRLAGARNGVDTALELFRSHGIRCIFATAYSDREARRRAEPAAPLGWLQKPYTMTSLTDLVRAAVREMRGKGRG